MGGVVVNDQMEIEISRGLNIDQLEKTQELSMPMARHASPNNRAIQHVQRRKQRRRAISLVVVGHGAGTPLLHGQPRLGAVESLDLALFVNTEDQRLVGRIEVEADHVLHLGRKVLVARKFESLDLMRLEPVCLPYPLNTAVRDTCRPRHAAQAPMGRIRRLLVQRHVHNLLYLLRRQWFDTQGRVASFSSPSTPLAVKRRRQRRTVSRLLPTAVAIAPAVKPSPAKSTIRALQTTFWGVFRSRTSRSNLSRSAALIEICSIFLIGAESQVRADL